MTEILKNIKVTESNMENIVNALKEQDTVEKICKEKSLNIILLRQFFLLASQGYNNTEIARKIGVHRITVQRYATALREMRRTDFEKVFKFVSNQIIKS